MVEVALTLEAAEYIESESGDSSSARASPQQQIHRSEYLSDTISEFQRHETGEKLASCQDRSPGYFPCSIPKDPPTNSDLEVSGILETINRHLRIASWPKVLK